LKNEHNKEKAIFRSPVIINPRSAFADAGFFILSEPLKTVRR